MEKYKNSSYKKFCNFDQNNKFNKLINEVNIYLAINLLNFLQLTFMKTLVEEVIWQINCFTNNL